MSNTRHFRRLEERGIDLVELLGGDQSLPGDSFAKIVNEVQAVGDELYADLMHLLSHRRFPEDEARRLWQGILKHKRKLTSRLGRDPGVRVAALDYLTNVRHVLQSARILDRGDFEQLRSSVYVDELTGLYNRRHIQTMYQREVRRARRYSNSLSVMTIDIDSFKQINDTHGHAAGDQVLVALAELLREVCRATDTIGRLGGDEILVLLPEARKSDAFALAERIRRAAREKRISVRAEVGSGKEASGEDRQSIGFSISIGVATYPDDSQESAELLELSDEALYASKRRGRDVVSLYPDSRGESAGAAG